MKNVKHFLIRSPRLLEVFFICEDYIMKKSANKIIETAQEMKILN